jgi:hypothetical protein
MWGLVRGYIGANPHISAKTLHRPVPHPPKGAKSRGRILAPTVVPGKPRNFGQNSFFSIFFENFSFSTRNPGVRALYSGFWPFSANFPDFGRFPRPTRGGYPPWPGGGTPPPGPPSPPPGVLHAGERGDHQGGGYPPPSPSSRYKFLMAVLHGQWRPSSASGGGTSKPRSTMGKIKFFFIFS